MGTNIDTVLGFLSLLVILILPIVLIVIILQKHKPSVKIIGIKETGQSVHIFDDSVV